MYCLHLCFIIGEAWLNKTWCHVLTKKKKDLMSCKGWHNCLIRLKTVAAPHFFSLGWIAPRLLLHVCFPRSFFFWSIFPRSKNVHLSTDFAVGSCKSQRTNRDIFLKKKWTGPKPRTSFKINGLVYSYTLLIIFDLLIKITCKPINRN